MTKINWKEIRLYMANRCVIPPIVLRMFPFRLTPLIPYDSHTDEEITTPYM